MGRRSTEHQHSIIPASPQLPSASRGWGAVGVNKPVMVGLAKTLVLGGSPKRLENHKTNRFKKFRLEGFQPVD